jgi:uncharacterized protein involved in exopolysaccharide biosynthesis
MADDGLGNLVKQIRRYTEFARRIARRWWLIVPLTLVGAGGSIMFALSTTRIYQSRAMVSWKESFQREGIGMQSTSHLPENFLYHRISQLTASDTLMLKLAEAHDLFPAMRGKVAPEVILEEMRDSIKFGIVGNDSFWIAFEYKDPVLAQKTTASLVEEFIQQNVRDKHRAAQGTQAFMEKEAAKVEKQLDDIASRLAKFRSEHPELQINPLTGLPQIVQPGGDQSAIRRRVRYLFSRDPKLQEALRRKGQLEAQLVEQNPRSDRRLARAREEYRNALRSLNSMRRRYSDQHPDVQRALRYVQQAKQQVSAATKSGSSRADEIRRQLRREEGRIKRLSRASRPRVVRDDASRDQPTVPNSSVARDAALQQKWYELNEERTVIAAKYQHINSQLQRSKLGAAIEQKQAKEEFTVVDKASLPGKPIRPSRKKIVLAGTALGIMLGLGLATLLVIFDPRIYNEDDLKKACNLPVLAQIPREP